MPNSPLYPGQVCPLVNGVLSLLDVTLAHDLAGKCYFQVPSPSKEALVSHKFCTHTPWNNQVLLATPLLDWGVFVSMDDPDEFGVMSVFYLA